MNAFPTTAEAKELDCSPEAVREAISRVESEARAAVAGMERIQAERWLRDAASRREEAESLARPEIEKRLIASYLGMTPENLSRALKTLDDVGITVHGQTVTITDRERLLTFVPPDALIDGPDTPGMVA